MNEVYINEISTDDEFLKLQIFIHKYMYISIYKYI